MTQHTCPHPRAQHRHGSGRCMAKGCNCLFGPPPVAARPMPEHTARTRTVVDESGIVLDFKREQSAKERLERMLWDRINEAGLPVPETQYHWARPERMFRSDFAYVEERILIEVQGGIWAANPGRHNRGSGYQDDARRTNLAMQLGWRLLAFTEAMIKSGEAVRTIGSALEHQAPIVQMPLTGGTIADAS